MDRLPEDHHRQQDSAVSIDQAARALIGTPLPGAKRVGA